MDLACHTRSCCRRTSRRSGPRRSSCQLSRRSRCAVAARASAVTRAPVRSAMLPSRRVQQQRGFRPGWIPAGAARARQSSRSRGPPRRLPAGRPAAGTRSRPGAFPLPPPRTRRRAPGVHSSCRRQAMHRARGLRRSCQPSVRPGAAPPPPPRPRPPPSVRRVRAAPRAVPREAPAGEQVLLLGRCPSSSWALQAGTTTARPASGRRGPPRLPRAPTAAPPRRTQDSTRVATRRGSAPRA